MRVRLIVLVLLTALIADCSRAGLSPTTARADVSTDAPPAAATPNVTPRSASPGQPTPDQPASPEATTAPQDPMVLRLYRQAVEALERWSEVAADASANAIVFPYGLTDGGGWRGQGADENKSAFVAGEFVAVVDLSSESPPPGEVEWPGGDTQSVELLSAAEALVSMRDEMQSAGGSCGGCEPLKIVDAKLVMRTAETSRGPAQIPHWKFELAAEDEPLDPIVHAAVRDRVILAPAEEWDPYGDNPIGIRVEIAYGGPEDSQITVLFVGSPEAGSSWCGADYTADAVESELAVVVLILESQHPPANTTPPPACRASGAGRTAVVMLDSPLGDRAVLEVQFGLPVPVHNEEPPPDPLAVD